MKHAVFFRKVFYENNTHTFEMKNPVYFGTVQACSQGEKMVIAKE